ncbi:DNA polymerase III subunit delta [Polymorphobacter sp.]|uniref:DNA polymerase III subunit delta n=1 Tax=Polymorphobacter sp. TaxID=1909290 RepID=UPI003F709B43
MAGSPLEALARQWPDGLRLVLLHGYEPGLTADHADTLTQALVDPANPAGLERLAADQLLHDPQALAAAVSNRSIFGDRIVVRVDGVDDRAAAAVGPVLDGPCGNPLVLVAGRLKATGALLTLVARNKLATVFEVKAPNAGQALDIVKDIAALLNMRCDRQTAQLLVETTGGERSLLRRELEKLALYLDAAPDHPATLDADAVLAVAAGTDFFDHAGLSTAAIAGRSADVVSLLSQIPAGEGVVALRFLAGRLALLGEIRAKMDAGASGASAVDGHRPPVFYKDKPAFHEALQRWTSRGLAAALQAVLTAEMALKSRGGLGDLEAQSLVLRVARKR